jgi:hypothetical protein
MQQFPSGLLTQNEYVVLFQQYFIREINCGCEQVVMLV